MYDFDFIVFACFVEIEKILRQFSFINSKSYSVSHLFSTISCWLCIFLPETTYIYFDFFDHTLQKYLVLMIHSFDDTVIKKLFILNASNRNNTSICMHSLETNNIRFSNGNLLVSDSVIIAFWTMLILPENFIYLLSRFFNSFLSPCLLLHPTFSYHPTKSCKIPCLSRSSSTHPLFWKNLVTISSPTFLLTA